jgi:hypothetical protein
VRTHYKGEGGNVSCSAASWATAGTLHPSSPWNSMREAEPDGQHRPRLKDRLASSSRERLWRSVNVEESRSEPQGLMTPKQKTSSLLRRRGTLLGMRRICATDILRKNFLAEVHLPLRRRDERRRTSRLSDGIPSLPQAPASIPDCRIRERHSPRSLPLHQREPLGKPLELFRVRSDSPRIPCTAITQIRACAMEQFFDPWR